MLYTTYMEDRVTGYILLVLGVVIMFFAIIQLGLLLTNVIKPFPAFNFTEVFTLIQDVNNQVNGEATQTAVSEVNPQVVNSVLNHSTYFLYMGFMLNLGFMLAQLGIKLIRPTTIQVHPKNIKDIVSAAPQAAAMSAPSISSPPQDITFDPPAAKNIF